MPSFGIAGTTWAVIPYGLVSGTLLSSFTITGTTFSASASFVPFSTTTLPASAFSQEGDQYDFLCVVMTPAIIPTTPLIITKVNNKIFPSGAPATVSTLYYEHTTLTKTSGGFFVSHHITSYPSSGAIPLFLASNGTGASSRGYYDQTQIVTSGYIQFICGAQVALGTNDLNFIRSSLTHGPNGDD